MHLSRKSKPLEPLAVQEAVGTLQHHNDAFALDVCWFLSGGSLRGCCHGRTATPGLSVHQALPEWPAPQRTGISGHSARLCPAEDLAISPHPGDLVHLGCLMSGGQCVATILQYLLAHAFLAHGNSATYVAGGQDW